MSVSLRVQKAKAKETIKQYWIKNPWMRHYDRARSRCKRGHKYGDKGVQFFLIADQVKYLWERDKASLMKCPSIDRINPMGHYEQSNCRFIERSLNCSLGAKSCNLGRRRVKINIAETMTVREIQQALARGYCTDRNKNKVLDPDLLLDMAWEIAKELSKKTFSPGENRSRIKIYEEALKKLATLGGTTSTGNVIAQEAIAKGAERTKW